MCRRVSVESVIQWLDAYIYSVREPIKEDVFQCLDNRTSILQTIVIGDRVIAKMKEFVEVYVKGMVA
jgi:type I restriction enzyme R subunit